jgi:hypothetical protein
MTQSEFDQWKHHFITKEFFQLCKERIEDVKDLLAGSAGLDQTEDNFRRGYITAINDILDFYATYPQEESDEASPTQATS